ncbi:MAG: hypothetical protein V4561_03540 [Bacteroidota bacterium]
MPQLFNTLLAIHIIGGVTALLSGSIILLRKKGDKLHKRIGKIFAYSMLLSATVSLILSRIHPNDFLFIIGIFSIYLVGTGMRILRLKKLNKDQKPAIIDWILFATMALFALLFIAYAGVYFKSGNLFWIVLLVFGLISILMLRSDWRTYKGKIKYKNYWLMLHLQRMTGAYIASLTAFLVVNNTYLPSIVAWLLPTFILTPFIIKWSKAYAK